MTASSAPPKRRSTPATASRTSSSSSSRKPMTGGYAPILISVAAVAASSSSFPSLLPAAEASNPETSSSGRCPYTCGEHGTCRPISSAPGSYECVCDAGWSGLDCSVPYVTCDDGKRRCYNNSECRRNSKPDPDTGVYGYKCDCSLAFGVSAFAGRECENSATVTCEASTPVSEHAFCTNGGQCKSYVLHHEEHAGCVCPPDFEGEHCQYLKGTAPAEEEEEREKKLGTDWKNGVSGGTGPGRGEPPGAYGQREGSGGESVGAGGIAAIIVVILGAFAAAVYAGRKYYLQQEGIERNYSATAGGQDVEEYDLKGRDGEVELASEGKTMRSKKTRASDAVAASMDLDPDGSSTMPPKVGEGAAAVSVGSAVEDGDKFEEEAARQGDMEGEII